jgi:four helix bundle protein
MKDFRNLEVWEKAHQLTLAAYEVTLRFPKEEMYGLTSQIRRAATSIPSNIAEGCGRGTDADFARFLQIAMGSASELEYELLLARDLGFFQYPDHAEIERQTQSVKQMLAALLRVLHKKESRSAPAQLDKSGKRTAESV